MNDRNRPGRTTEEALATDVLAWHRALLDLMPGPTMILSQHIYLVLGCNRAAADLFRASESSLVEMSTFDLSREQDHGAVRRAGTAFATGTIANHEVEKTMVRPDGTQFRARLRMDAVAEPHPVHGHVVLAQIDPLESEVKAAPAVGLATISQNVWRDAYDHAIRETHQPGSDTRATVAAIGVRSIERSMERLGWTSGRALSAAVVRRVTETMRESDLVVELYGGTTALLLRGVHDPVAAESIVGRMVEMFDHPVYVGGEAEHVEVQAGAVCVDAAAVDADAALTMAVAALNVARANGRNVSVFDPATARRRRGERVLEERICSGIQAGLVRGAVQPIVSLRTNEMVGVEALARLELPPVGPISPETFIPLASQRGLTPRVTEQVLSDGFDAIRRLGSLGHELDLSLNVSGEQLTRTFPEWLAAHLPQHVRPEDVQIEVTESVLIEREESLHVLHELAEAGYQIAIDDFGTGYSSLTYLAEWPAHVVKLDKSFVGPIDTGDKRSMSIVRSVIDLANDLGLVTVAEGVERPAQLELLRDWGCDKVQGYLLSRPVWPDQIETVFNTISEAKERKHVYDWSEAAQLEIDSELNLELDS